MLHGDPQLHDVPKQNPKRLWVADAVQSDRSQVPLKDGTTNFQEQKTRWWHW
jgi:hypothetical protein